MRKINNAIIIVLLGVAIAVISLVAEEVFRIGKKVNDIQRDLYDMNIDITTITGGGMNGKVGEAVK